MSTGKLSYCRADRGTGESAPAAVDGDTSSIIPQISGISFADRTPSSDDWGAIEQVVGKAGDIVLLHPWCVHSGTYQLNHSLAQWLVLYCNPVLF
jgi:hypothetical protein